MKYFVDTSFWCALYNSRDENNPRAMRLWETFVAAPVQLFTSEYVFDETVTIVKRRMDHRSAVELGTAILQSRVVTIWEIDHNICIDSWQLFKTHADKGFSFTDCTSFVLMRSYGLNQALSFDRHFNQMGFTVNTA